MASNIESPSGARKRSRNEDNWVTNVAKRQRNLGQEYKSPFTGKTVVGREIGPPCPCKMKCFEKIGHDTVHAIHNEYWATGNKQMQEAFVQKHSKQKEVARRTTENEENLRSGNWVHWVYVDNKEVVICKKAFASIIGIQPIQINRYCAKVTPAGVQIPDGRGHHSNHYRIPPENHQLVRTHIDSIPKVTSHYCRKASQDILYLQQNVMSLVDLYNLYITWLRENGK